MQIAVFGAGLVGRRAAQMLARTKRHQVSLVAQTRRIEPLDGVQTATGWPSQISKDAEIVILAIASSQQFAMTRELLRAGVHVIATADAPTDVARLWTLDGFARECGASLAVGAGYSPGISTLLAATMVRRFDQVSAISTARFGTGGPACAREHHRAMGGWATEVHDGSVRHIRSQSGRQLVWFPEPVGAADCYRGGLADPFLLHKAFPQVPRIESRLAATRRDRLTARLPMLRRPHAEGLLGATWVEVRGTVGGQVEHAVMGATAPQATGAAAMAAEMANTIATTITSVSGTTGVSGLGHARESSQDETPGLNVRGIANFGEGIRLGTWSAATFDDPVVALQALSNDVRLWTYEGARAVVKASNTAEIQAARKWKPTRT